MLPLHSALQSPLLYSEWDQQTEQGKQLTSPFLRQNVANLHQLQWKCCADNTHVHTVPLQVNPGTDETFFSLIRTFEPFSLFPYPSNNVATSVTPPPLPALHLVILSLHSHRLGRALLRRPLACFPFPAFPRRASGCCGEAAAQQHLSCSSLLLPFLPNSTYQRAEEGEAFV